MTYDYHTLFGTLSVLIGILGYVPYYRDMFRGTTKPHPFTYLIWGVLAAVTLVAQLVEGAGPGAWATAIPVFTGLSIAIFAFFWRERGITRMDWVCLVGALMAMGIWRLTSEPLYAVLVVIAIDILAKIPTFRKSYSKPDEETALSYGIGAIRSIVALPALISINLVTVLPLVFHIASNGALVGFLLIRRRQLQKKTVGT